jgi:hypothetical protein
MISRGEIFRQVVPWELSKRVIRSRGGARLLDKAAQPVGIIGEGPRQDLHRDLPVLGAPSREFPGFDAPYILRDGSAE